MKIFVCLQVAILACLVRYSTQQCTADMVFMIDSSSINNYFTDFYNALDSFSRAQVISNSGLRLGAVFYNDVDSQSRIIPLTGDRNSFTNQLFTNRFQLGGGILNGVGLNAANNLFNNANRRVPRVAVLVTPNPSQNGNIPISIANTLQLNTGGASMTIYTIGVARNGRVDYNVNELNVIATGNVIPLASSSGVLNEFNRIVAEVCRTVIPVPSSICTAAEVDSGAGYKPNPNDCRRFFQCKRDDFSENILIFDQACPDGLFWRQSDKTCVRFPESDCYRGECDSGTYIFESLVCGAYFNCTNGVVSSNCCPRNANAFDPVTKTCVFSAECPFNCVATSTVSTPSCADIYKPHIENGVVNPCKYEVHIGEGETKKIDIMSCADGTIFNPQTCSCPIPRRSEDACPQRTTGNGCDPFFDLSFSGNVARDTANAAWIDAGSVTVNNNLATFNGGNDIKVVRFSNMDFVLPLAIKLRYRETSSQSNMAVLTTGGTLSRPGVYITGGNGRTVIGVVTVNNGVSVTLEASSVAAGVNQWKEVVLFYDGLTLEGIVRTLDNNGINIVSDARFPSQRASDDIIQRLAVVEGPLELGYGSAANNLQGFVGDIDEVKIWKGCRTVRFPQDF